MATDKGVWGLQQVRDKQLQSLWTYSAPGGDGGKIFSWGTNTNGQLGLNNKTEYSSPTQIPGTNWSSLALMGDDGAADATTTLSWSATKSDGTLWSWGSNEWGELGLNNRTEYNSPVQVPGTTWRIIAGEGQFRAAIKTDGTLWTWGRNLAGELGLNQVASWAGSSDTRISSPTQVPGTTWSKVSCGYRFVMATKTDGTLWTWGASSDGSLGLNDNVRRSSPCQVGSGTDWSEPNAGRDVQGAIKTDGTLWMWGRGHDGATGQNNRTDRSSPIQVPGTTWRNISIGTQPYVVATKTDGTSWAWGNGKQGQLGQNQGSANIYYSSPTQIGTDTTWDTMSAGYHSSTGIKTDGTLWTWGDNPKGNLGHNDTVQRSSPVQIPGTNWSKAAQGYYFTVACEDL
jgi:alpha-tubulin suppressor-like RCC1 family protein